MALIAPLSRLRPHRNYLPNSTALKASLHSLAGTAMDNLASSTLLRSTLNPLSRMGKNTMRLWSPEYHPKTRNFLRKLFTDSTAEVLTHQRAS
jgi:hypothetical protein